MKDILERWKVHYKRLAAQQVLAESLVEQEELPEQAPASGDAGEYAERLSDHELMKSVVGSLQEGEDNESVLALIRSDEWENPDAQRFMDSLTSSKRGGFLTPYSISELASMNLFKLKDHNLGFAIKNDGDIVSVHNNSGVGGIGEELMTAAVRNGGSKLDHFDGFLTGFYNKTGFGKIVGKDAWNDQYAPENWKYESVNIFDPRTSIYARELAKYDTIGQVPDELKAKIRAYESGRPDIVYRARG